MNKSLFVAGLDFSIDDSELGQLFSQCGSVVSAKVITDHYSGKSRGFGFVEMGTYEEAADAIEKLNESDVKGRKVIVKFKESKPRTSNRNRDYVSNSF